MPQTCRQYWWNLQGRCTLNFNWDAINHDSVVLITRRSTDRTRPILLTARVSSGPPTSAWRISAHTARHSTQTTA